MRPNPTGLIEKVELKAFEILDGLKSEIRISKSETNPKFEYRDSNLFSLIHLDFESRLGGTCFEFRASNFEFKILEKDSQIQCPRI